MSDDNVVKFPPRAAEQVIGTDSNFSQESFQELRAIAKAMLTLTKGPASMTLLIDGQPWDIDIKRGESR